MRQLLERLGNPHEQAPAVHVTGTKGKGSTAAMIAAVARAGGYRVGLFTSPHISAFEERMSVGGRLPSRDEVVELVNCLVEPVAALDAAAGEMSPTYFELTTAMAWLYFARWHVELAVLEVGLGGRLDATNICRPAVCVITTISRDHMHLLGSEVTQIAREKAGIIKPGVPIVSGVLSPESRNVIEEVAAARGAPLFQLGRDFRYDYHPRGKEQTREVPHEPAKTQAATVDFDSCEHAWHGLPVPLRGEHQGHNVALAVAAIERLQAKGWRVSEREVRAGLPEVRWPARVEVVAENPTTVIDAAHNWASVAALVRTLSADFQPRSRVLVFAATRDKDTPGMLRQLLSQFDTVILTCYLSNPRSLPVEQLLQLARGLTDRPLHLAPDPRTAWELAGRIAGPDDLICVAGSFFIAAEIRELLVPPDPRAGTTAAPP